MQIKRKRMVKKKKKKKEGNSTSLSGQLTGIFYFATGPFPGNSTS